MNGLIITNQEVGHNEYKIKRFNDEFANFGISLRHFINDGSLAIIKDEKIVINLPKADFVIYLDKDIYLARQLELSGYRLFNKADFIKLCDDKMLTNIYCANKQIRMPKTISGPLFYSEKLTPNNLTFLNHVSDALGFPLIMKKVYGSLGTGVYLISNKNELTDIYTQCCREPIQFQEYISSSYGKSIRIIIIDGKVIGGFMRYNPNDFRSNYGNTASSEKIEICGEYLDFATKIAKNFSIEYAGIDLLIGPNKEPILCEINSNAFFEEFEKVTGINVAYLFARMVSEKIKNEQQQK